MSSEPTWPFVSVIVPVRNDLGVTACIEALLGQTYPRDRYEILIVDNGSTDGTPHAIKRHPVTLLVEDRLSSSYAARNKGVRYARGEVIALADADCRPEPRWIEEGVKGLHSHAADLVGGHVAFLYSARPSGAEIFDAQNNMQQERDIRKRRVAKTANLFVRAHVFDRIGLFPEVQSGADVYWTRRATDHGLVLAFAPRAVVTHPARRLGALLRKGYRVGRGRHDRYCLERDDVRAGAAERTRTNPGYGWTNYRPPHWTVLRGLMAERGLPATWFEVLRAWSAGWLYRITMAFGSTARYLEGYCCAPSTTGRSIGGSVESHRCPPPPK
jgi:glycosyltransferase involved in cell wall biosynthesis